MRLRLYRCFGLGFGVKTGEGVEGSRAFGFVFRLWHLVLPSGQVRMSCVRGQEASMFVSTTITPILKAMTMPMMVSNICDKTSA